MKTIIDFKTGNINLSGKIMISKDQRYNEISKLKLIKNTWDVANGYKWIYFLPIEIEQLNYQISACYFEEQLSTINLSFHQIDSPQKTWNDWSEEKELSMEKTYEDWLTEQVGSERIFEWGAIGVYYDIKGGGTSINIKYK